jgi:hypothetical protein
MTVYSTDPVERPGTFRLNRIAWSSVFAGVAIALIVHVLLSLLGLGVGLATVHPVDGGSPDASTFSLSAGIWAVVSGIIAAAAGGYVAGRTSGVDRKDAGVFHGLTTWAATTLIILYLLTTTVGALVGGAFSGVTSTLSGAGSAIATTAQSAVPALATATDPMGSIESGIRNSSGDDPAALRDKAVSAVRAALTGDPAQQEQAKTQAADALAKAQNIPQDQARAQIDKYQAEYTAMANQTKEQAKQAADTAAKAGSLGAFVAFFALVLGALAGALGGRSGAAALRTW